VAAYDKNWKTVKVEIADGICWLYFNRPEKRNAMSPTLNREMGEALDAIELDDAVKVVVLTGEGVAWSAGMDLKEYFREIDGAPDAVQERIRREASEWQWKKLRFFGKPTIAMVNGWCFGGGFGPLFACDLAICADEAQFGLSEINWGILPGGGVTKVAVELMPFRDAMWMTLTGELIDGKKAAEWKLVNESVPLARLEARVREVANILLQKNPVALKFSKDAVRRVKAMQYDEAEDYLVRMQEAANFHDKTEGRKEGIRQFIDEKSYKPGLGSYDLSKAKQSA
jgi:trans-feruloyl-CoA hydratase/vanillin synthase